jgi:hypothetical protein
MTDIVRPLWAELVTVRGVRGPDDVIEMKSIDPAE